MPMFNGITNASLDARYGALVQKFAPDAIIQRMSGGSPIAPPLMTSPPTITDGVADAALTAQYLTKFDKVRWDGPVTFDGSIATVPRYYHYADNSGFASGRPSATIQFDTDAAKFSLRIIGKPGFYYRVWVDGLATAASLATVANTGGGSTYIHCDFGSISSQPRRILIELECVNGIDVRGIYTAPTALVAPPSAGSPRVMMVGDSYGAGGSATRNLYSYQRHLGRLMGWSDCWTHFTSVGSTGFVDGGSVTVGPYGTRLSDDVIAYSPDLVLLQGSVNDEPYLGDGSIGAAVADYVNTLKAALPDCVVVITGCLAPHTLNTTRQSLNNEMKAAAAALGVPFLDLQTPNPYFTGTGKVGAPANNGPADRFMTSDDTHPSTEGHAAIAVALAGKLRAALGL